VKDPTEEILNAFRDRLLGVTYKDEEIQVFEDMPEIKIYKYILLDEVNFSDDSTNDSDCVTGTITIEVGMSGWGFQSNRSAVNSVMNDVFQLLIKKKMETSNFYIGVEPYIANIATIKEKIGNDILVRRIVDFGFKTEQK